MNLLLYRRGSSNVSTAPETSTASTAFVDNEIALFDLLSNYHFRQTKKLISDDDENNNKSRQNKDDGGDGNKKDKEDDDEEELLYYKIAILIEQTPAIVHSYNIDGYTPLQLICSNPLLASNIQLIKLLIDTSAQLEWETDSPNNNNNNNTKKAVNTVGNKHHHQYRNHKNIKSTTNLIPTPAKVIYQKSKNMDEQMVLHISCLNAFYTTIDIIDYIIHCHPSAVCHKNKSNGNLPIHNACVATTVSIVPIEFIILLVQQWPESLHEINYDGNLPLHLVCHIYFHSKTTNTSTTTTTTTTTNSNSNKNGVNKLSIMNHRYEYQLQIIQYIVDYYPDAIFIKNKNNETPSQIAYNSSHSFYDIDDNDEEQYDPSIRQRKRDLHPIVSFLYEFEKQILKQKEKELKQKQQLDDMIIVTQSIPTDTTTPTTTTLTRTITKDTDFTLDENGRKTRVIKRGIVAKKSGDIAEGILSNPWKDAQPTRRLGRKKTSDDPLGALKVLTDDTFSSIPKNSNKNKMNSNHMKNKSDLINDDDDDDSSEDDDDNTTTSDDDASVAKYLNECLTTELIEKNIVIPTTITDTITPTAIAPTAPTNTIITTTKSASNILIGGDDSQKSFPNNTSSHNNISVYDDSNTSNNHESVTESSLIGDTDFDLEDEYIISNSNNNNVKVNNNKNGLQSYIERMSMSKTIRLDEFRQSIDDLDTLIVQDDEEENDDDHEQQQQQQQQEKEQQLLNNNKTNDLLVYPTLRKKESIGKMTVMNDYPDDIMNEKNTTNNNDNDNDTTSNNNMNNQQQQQQQQQQNIAIAASKEKHKNILQKSHEKMKQMLLHSNKVSPPDSPKNKSNENSPKSSRSSNSRKVVDNNKMINFFPTRESKKNNNTLSNRSLSSGRSRLSNANRSLSTGRSRLHNADDFLKGIREARKSTTNISSTSNRDVVDTTTNSETNAFFPKRDTRYSMNDISKKNTMSNADDFVKSIREARLEATLSPEVIPKKSIINLQSLNIQEIDGNNINDHRRLSSSSEHNNHRRLSSSSEHNTNRRISSSSEHNQKTPVISENRIFHGSSEHGKRSIDVYVPPSINLLSDDEQIPSSSLDFEYQQRMMNDDIIDDLITPVVNNRRKIKVTDHELPETFDIMENTTKTNNDNYYTKTKKSDEQRKISQPTTYQHEDVSGNNDPDYNYYDEYYDDDTNTTYSNDDESTNDNNNNNNDKRTDDHNDEKRKKKAYRRRIKKLVNDPTSENLEI